MVRGILMSREGQKAILLTKDGTFEKVRLKKNIQVTVGQSIYDSHIAPKLNIAKNLPLSLASCLFATIIFFAISGFIRNNAIAAYVSIDINPSIEAAVNRNFEVVKVHGLNDDGKSLLKNGIDYKNMPLKEFSLAIADALSEKGYLKDAPDIVVSTTLTDKVDKDKRERFVQKINQAVNKLSENHAFQKNNGSLEVFNTTMDRRQEAQKAGVSTGKYLIYLKESKLNANLKLSQVKKMTVKELHHNKGHGHDVVESSLQQSETIMQHKDLTPSVNWMHWDNGKHNMKKDHQDKNKNDENTSFLNNGKSLTQPKKNSIESTKVESIQQSSWLQHQQFFKLEKENRYKFFPSHLGKGKWQQNENKGNDQHKQKHAG